MGYTQLVLNFVDRHAFEVAYRDHLRFGRAEVRSDTALATGISVVLVLVHPETGSVLTVQTESVTVEECADGYLVGLIFVEAGAEVVARVGGFLAEMAEEAEGEEDVGGETGHEYGHEGGREYEGGRVDAQVEDASEQSARGERALAHTEESEHGESEREDERGDEEEREKVAGISPRIERLRNLNEAQRMVVARGSVLEDRVVLERLYGNSVWPLLLHNPKISVAEVARMARKGTMPRPLLDFVAENEGWIRQSLVRRALLSNPRLSPDSTLRVLRATPPRELKLVPQQTAYPMQVRTLAQRMIRGSSPGR